MTRLQKDSRYTHKNLVNKREEKSLRMKLLRYVMAVGFVLSPWLGGEAYAGTATAPGIVRVDGTKFLDGTSNVAHIYAQDVDSTGKVGLNSFKDFNVVAGEIANLYFKTSSTDTNHLNTLVNTVQERISISGTVNAIRDGKIGGNLYFVSPKGMIVGSTGVINAGSLTMVAKDVNISTADQASTYVKNGWGPPDSETSIYIHGRINTETGIDLQTETVNITKDGSPNPHLLTGVVFKKIVNNDFTNVQAWDVSQRRLTLTKGEDGKIAIIDPSTSEEVARKEVTSSGDGMINIRAKTDAGGNVFSGAFVLTNGSIDAIGDLEMDIGADITINSSSSIKANKITMSNNNGNIKNDGIIEGLSDVTIHVLGADNKFFVEDLEGNEYGTNCLVNRGTIKSTGGGISLYGKNGISNYGTIEASGEIKMTALNGVVNQGMIKSNNSNVSFVVGREFFNVAKNDTYNIATYVPHNLTYLNNNIEVLIEAGGNVQISYTDKTTGTIGKNPNDTNTVTYAPIGIYNSSTMRSGTAISATGGGGTSNAGSGSGNIWLTSSYNITNRGTMEAGRQITLNARDFLHNHGTIEGVTYLDIKSIMGYVYNHDDGVIRATGGNIDLSSGQANLQIDKDTDGTKKEEYRKFTPIIIEGLVEATSALNNKDNETNQGNINITANLGDIYVVEGTIGAIAKTNDNGEVESAAGNVILDAAQNITIGFQTERADADDPTTDKEDNREYYKPILDSNLVPSSPCQNPATISGTNITLKSGSDKKYNILMSNTTTGSNTLTASDTINLTTDNMQITGGTIKANTLAASGSLDITGGSVGSTGALTISGAKGVTIGSAATITTGNNLTIASSGGAVTNSLALTATTGSVTMSGKTGVGNSVNANITANSGISMIASSGAIANSSALNGGSGSVVLNGSRGITNSANITAGQNITLQSTIEVIENRGILSAGQGIGLTSTEGTILNNGMLTARGSSVSLKGYKGITNNGDIEAKGNVSIISDDGSITNRAGIVAGKSFATPAASPFSLRARAMARAVDNGSVVISGKGDVVNTAGATISAKNSVVVTSEEGAVNNSSAITAKTGSVEIVGSSGVTNNENATIIAGNNVGMTADTGIIQNSGTITADNNVSMRITEGTITNSSSVTATGGSVTMNGSGNVTGGTVTGNDVVLKSGGSVTVGTVTGSKVAITGGSGGEINVDKITVDNSLQLQGDNISANDVGRGNASSDPLKVPLKVDVSGAGGTDSTAKGDVDIIISGDVVFSNVNVSKANVQTTGNLEVKKLHVEGNAQFASGDNTVNVYGQGVPPDPNDTTAIQDKGDGNSGWLTLKIDDTGVQSVFVGEEARTDYPVQLSAKLVDFDPYDTYLEHYGDVADIFGRTDLIIAAESPSGDFTQGDVVILKQDAEGLSIEEAKKEEKKE